MNKRGIATVMTLLILALLACVSATPPGQAVPPAYSALTPSPLSGNNQDPAYAAAQATLAAGQSEMMGLSHQATVVSLAMAQAAGVAAQATLDYHQRQLMELSIQGTEVSLNVARAAATQQAIIEQAQVAQNATATAESRIAVATAQSQAATATYAAYVLNVTQTAQVQAIADARARGTAQAHATLTAYPLTATPAAAIQASIVRNRDASERRVLWQDSVVTPLKVFLSTLVVLLLIAGGVMAYRRLMPVVEYRLRNPRGNGNLIALPVTEGTIVELHPHQYRLMQGELHPYGHPELPSDEMPQVEVIAPSEPLIINWITEAERKLRTKGGIQL